jgi:hypothetical protein
MRRPFFFRKPAILVSSTKFKLTTKEDCSLYCRPDSDLDINFKLFIGATQLAVSSHEKLDNGFTKLRLATPLLQRLIWFILDDDITSMEAVP